MPPNFPADLSTHARNALDCAYDEARAHQHDRIDVDHILLGLLGPRKGSAFRALDWLGVDPRELDYAYRSLMPIPSRPTGDDGGGLYFSLDADRCLIAAQEAAEQQGYPQLGTQHLLLGLFRVQHRQPAAFLRYRGVTVGDLGRFHLGARGDARAETRSGRWWQGRINVIDELVYSLRLAHSDLGIAIDAAFPAVGEASDAGREGSD